MNEIRIPFEFVWQDGVFGWLLDDTAKAMIEGAVQGGIQTREAADEMLAQDAALRELPGAFVGHLLFRRELDRDGETVLWSSAMADAADALNREQERAKAAGRQPVGRDLDAVASGIAFRLRAEMLFEGVEGHGAENFSGWDSLPEAVRQAVPVKFHRKVNERQRTVDDLLKKTPAASPKRKGR